MSASLAFVDTGPEVKARGEFLEIHLVSGEGTHSFVLTKRIAGYFNREIARSLAVLHSNSAEIIPLTKKRRKAMRLAKRDRAA